MTLYYYKLYWRRNFQLTLRQKCMNIQHGYYSHSFMKFPENFKISQIGSSDDLQPPLQLFFPPKYLLIWFQWVSYKADEYIVPWHNMENALIFLETYHLHLLIFMKLYLNNPVHLLSAFSTLQFNVGFDRWKKSHYVDMLQYIPLKPNHIFVLWKPIYLHFMSIKTYLKTWIGKKIIILNSLKNIHFLWLKAKFPNFSLTLEDLFFPDHFLTCGKIK